jgi:hypothetical protein
LRGGNLRITDSDGTKYLVSRGHFDLARKQTSLPPGSRVTAAEDIHRDASHELILLKGTPLEVLSIQKGRVKVIDGTGVIDWVHPAQLDVDTEIDILPDRPASSIADRNDIHEEIRRLAELRRERIISAEQFET